MRDDIIGMLRNAIDHGGDPMRVAQSLINSGYPVKDVKEAYEYVRSTVSQLNQQQPAEGKPPVQVQQPQVSKPPVQSSMPQAMQPRPTPQQMQSRSIPLGMQPKPAVQPPSTIIRSSSQLLPRQLPSQKVNPAGTGKITVLVIILVLLVLSLISLIVFKDTILDLF